MKPVKILIVIFLIFLFFLTFRFWTFANKTLNISVFKAVFTKGSLKILDNSTNILILGIPGLSYEGPYLTDSITVINYNFSKNRATLIGVPRDIWSEPLKDKVNTSFAYGESVRKGGGLILAKAEVGSIIGLPIQYGIIVDFDDFKKIVDYLEGINVDVERTFIDKKYPIKGKEDDDCAGDKELNCRYQVIKFEKGMIKMNGETALKFIRSRNAIGTEGNDFARIKRQQLVMDSIKQKILSQINIINMTKLKNIYHTVNPLIERDITNQQAAAIAKNILIKRNFEIVKKSIPSELFLTPDYTGYNGKYVLIPKGDNLSEIHKYILDSLN